MRRAGESSSFLRRAARFDLGSLPSYEVEEAVRITIESAGRTISQPALDAAVQAIGGLGSGNAPALPQPRARACLRGWNPVVLRLGTGFLSSAAAGGGQLCHNSSVRHASSLLEEPL